MLREATGPINFTMFLKLFGEKLHGEPPPPSHTGRNFTPRLRRLKWSLTCCSWVFLWSQRCSSHRQVKQMFQSSNIDAAGNLDYKSLCYIITHWEEQEE
uniref:myosin light chain 5-like n=1 Tax=Monopterus albus TaxID=43700 RepID=UPI0009B36226|nr:myosin light chain 5-like [Monopterus albus]